jgi:hypothetical protein
MRNGSCSSRSSIACLRGYRVDLAMLEYIKLSLKSLKMPTHTISVVFRPLAAKTARELLQLMIDEKVWCLMLFLQACSHAPQRFEAIHALQLFSSIELTRILYDTASRVRGARERLCATCNALQCRIGREAGMRRARSHVQGLLLDHTALTSGRGSRRGGRRLEGRVQDLGQHSQDEGARRVVAIDGLADPDEGLHRVGGALLKAGDRVAGGNGGELVRVGREGGRVGWLVGGWVGATQASCVISIPQPTQASKKCNSPGSRCWAASGRGPAASPTAR